MANGAFGVAQTDQAMDHAMDQAGVRAGRIADPIDLMLVRLRIVSDDDLDRARRDGLAHGVSARTVLVSSATISQDDLAEAVSCATGHPRGSVTGAPVDERVLERLEESWTRRHRALPLRIEDGRLVVAVVEPLGSEVEQALLQRFPAVRAVSQVVVTTAELDRARLGAYRDYYLYEAVYRAVDENLRTVDPGARRGRLLPRRASHGASAEQPAAALPTYTLLLPVGPDLAVATRVIRAARALDYPPHLLDVKLLCPQGSPLAATLSGLLLPPHLHVVVVPDQVPATVTALHNYGLAMADGDLTVAYDAGQVPSPDQLRRAVEAFCHRRPSTGLARVTVGGGWVRSLTTVHHRTAALRASGGWRRGSARSA